MTYQEISQQQTTYREQSEQLVDILKIQSQALLAAHEFLNKEGII